jgi:hypothetical protein
MGIADETNRWKYKNTTVPTRKYASQEEASLGQTVFGL